MKKVYQAFTEISVMLNHMDNEIINKIPKSFILFIEKNKDLKYKVNIDWSKKINDQPLLKETRIILALLYRDYICSLEEKNKLLKLDYKELKIQELVRNKKYDLKLKNIKNKTVQYSKEKNNMQSVMPISKKTLYYRIKNNIRIFILKLLSKNI